MGSPLYLKSFLPTCPAPPQSLQAGCPLMDGKQFIWNGKVTVSFGDEVVLQGNWGAFTGLGVSKCNSGVFSGNTFGPEWAPTRE